MELNLPILDMLASSHNILIVGTGGGNDVYAGLPLYFVLKAHGKSVHLANYTFCDFPIVQRVSKPHVLVDNLVLGAQGIVEIPISYFPEGYLAQWFKVVRGEEITVWMFAKTGALPLTKGYKALAEHLSIDTLILVDGGVDSLMRGDESWPGTLVEDAISLTAASKLDVPIKILACIGMGTEIEEQVSTHHALENMAALIRESAFYGACALTPQMEAFQLYEAANRYLWSQANHLKSHIHTRVIPAIQGQFGNYHEFDHDMRHEVFLSPLMSLYWFFDANQVIARNLFISALQSTQTVYDAFQVYERILPQLTMRPRRSIPC